MKAGLAHALTPAGEVRLTLTAADGARLCVVVSAEAAKAKAWGMLADLDPDEAAALIAPPLDQGVEYEPAKDVRLGQSNRLLVALRGHGPSTTHRLVLLTGLESSVIGARLTREIRLGHVVKLPPVRRPGWRGVYEITSAGLAYLAPRVP